VVIKPNLIAFCFVAAVILLGLALTSCAAVQKSKEPADSSLSDIRERGVLVVGTSSGYEPMEFFDSEGKLVGIDIDIANEIGHQLGLEVQIKDLSWGELFNSVKSGETDIIICTITITPERAQEMLFSIPYFSSGQVVVVRQETQGIETIEDLAGHKVGAQKDTTCETAAMAYIDDSMLVRYGDGVPLPFIIGLKNKEVDAIVMDYIAALEVVKKDNLLKIIGQPFTQEYYGIATRLGNDALMSGIDRTLREMKRTGMLKGIEDRWM